MLTKQKLFLSIFTIVAILFYTGLISAETLTYKNSISGKDFFTETLINKTDGGYIVKTKNKSSKAEHIHNTDPVFSLLKWKYNDPENGTDISAERSGNTIFITGQFKNEKYEKKLKINELPWYEAWGLGLKTFINSDKDETLFWSIDPKSLKIAKFEAKKIKAETINVNGKKIETVNVSVNLAGFLKLFWGGGQMWFRKNDGTLVYKKMDSKNPQNNTQLISEK